MSVTLPKAEGAEALRFQRVPVPGSPLTLASACSPIGLVNLTIFQHYYAQKPCPRRRSFQKARQVGVNIAEYLSF
jgi:hypothetical protein